MISGVGTYVGSPNVATATIGGILPNTPTSQKAIASPSDSVTVRVVVDPSAGLVTQYLDSHGNVKNQFPSSVTVAYLRAGLTSDGEAPVSLAAPQSSPTVSTTA